MNDVAISFSDLGHAYRADRWVFRNHTAVIRKGRSFAVLGPNGRGKTTLLKILLGVLKPTAGSVQTNAAVAYVPQLFQVTFDYSVLDMVLMGRAKKIRLFSSPSANDRKIALQTLDRLGMGDLASHPFHELSGGQRQLVVFARALVAEAGILLLDEPTSSLDLKNQELVLDWISRLSRENGLTIVFTTHLPNHALAIADDALLMMNQSSFVCGPVNDTLSEENLQRLFGIPQKRIRVAYDDEVFETSVPVFSQKGWSRPRG